MFIEREIHFRMLRDYYPMDAISEVRIFKVQGFIGNSSAERGKKQSRSGAMLSLMLSIFPNATIFSSLFRMRKRVLYIVEQNSVTQLAWLMPDISVKSLELANTSNSFRACSFTVNIILPTNRLISSSQFMCSNGFFLIWICLAVSFFLTSTLLLRSLLSLE